MKFKQLLSLSLSVMILSGSVWANSSDMLTADVRVTVNPSKLHQTAPIPGASRKVTMSLHGVAVQDALRALARQGGFNVLIDESVQGSISVDLNNVSIQDALETLKSYSNLAYSVQGNNVMVADAASDKGKAYQKTTTRLIKLHNSNAKTVADLLNKSVFADRQQSAISSGTAQGMPVTADYHTNSLVVVGSPSDINAVMEHVEVLDRPRQMKTWRLSQANALDVATILSSSLFNEGQPAIVAGTSGSSGASTTTTGANGTGTTGMASTIRVTADNISEGTGATQSSQSGGNTSGGSSGGSSGSSGQTSVVNDMTLRGRVKATQSVQISPNGPILIPDTRLNTITLLGTAEQIGLVENLIPTLDRKIPQVVLEASLVEISEGGRKELSFNTGFSTRYTSAGSNNSPSSTSKINQPFGNPIGRLTDAANPFETLFQMTSQPTSQARDFMFQINALVSKNKARILANPTVITSSDNEAIISIVDEIIKSVTVTQGFGLATPTMTHNIGEAGIVLNILPRIGADGTVSMRIRPVISTIAGTRRDRFNNEITLISKREVLTQNTILKDGETFTLGGLINDTSKQTVYSNPILSKLPIVGALARNTFNTKARTELVILITPHIINDDAAIARSQQNGALSQIVPLIAGPKSGNVPVTLQGNSKVLPPMEGVQVLHDGVPASTLAPQNTSRIYPAVSDSRDAEHVELKTQPTSWTNAATDGSGISDETVRNIINKFR